MGISSIAFVPSPCTVVELVDDPLKVAVELADVQFIDDEVVDFGDAEGVVGPGKWRGVVINGESGERPQAGCPAEGVGEPEGHFLAAAEKLETDRDKCRAGKMADAAIRKRHRDFTTGRAEPFIQLRKKSLGSMPRTNWSSS